MTSYRGVNPAVRTRVPIIVRIERDPNGGWCFAWYLTRRYGLKRWRAFHAYQRDFREARAAYYEYARYWRTGQF